ncbi:LysR substrate binding domain protein [compost metagenome]
MKEVHYGKLDYRNIEYASLDMIKQTVISGTGIALVPKCSVEEELATNQLKILNLGEQIYIRHGMIEVNTTHTKETSNIFRTFILEIFKVEADLMHKTFQA